MLEFILTVLVLETHAGTKHGLSATLAFDRGRRPGLLATAGRLLFGGDVSGNFFAMDPANGSMLWHARIGTVSNAPQTYKVGGRQHVLVAAGDALFSFALY